MRTALPWPPAIVAALFTATPLFATASEDTTPPAATAAAKPQAAPAAPKSAAPAAAAKPAGAAGATAPTAAKPAGAAGATAPTAAKPAGAAAPGPAKPATPAAAGAAGTAGTPAAGAAKPAAAPAGTASAPSPTSAPVDPASANLTLAQATAGLKGTGAIVATIEIASEGKPAQALHCELYADKAPVTVANFIALGRGLRQWKDPKTGQWVKRPLYDGNLLHRVIPELLIQGGDPNCSGDPSCRSAPGVGDPGYTIVDEIRPELRFDRAGRLAMSNRGPNTGGSQFFITEREAAWLTGSNTIFGQCDGAELVAQLSRVETGSRDQPKAPLTIKRITFARKGS